jgi:RNA polymerase sigma-70 factor (ECF subfamily)
MPSERDREKSINTEVLLKNPGEFKVIYERYHLNVFRYIYGLHGGSIEDVEDLTAVTFIRAWKSRYRFIGRVESVLPWLLKIAKNLIIDQSRSKKNNPISLDIEQQFIRSNELTPEEFISQKEQFKKLWKLLSKISDNHREIIVLRYILGWRVKSIAEYLEMKENTVSVTIRRILKQIQDEWLKE